MQKGSGFLREKKHAAVQSTEIGLHGVRTVWGETGVVKV